MHIFQPSRGRIFFEVLCALGIVASCVGAWKQTGASALLLAASVAGLYGFVHLFDLARRNPPKAEESQRIDFEPEVQAEVPAYQPVDAPVAVIEPEPVARLDIEEREVSEPAAPRTGAGRRKGGSRKGAGRRAAPKGAKVAAVVMAEEAKPAEVVPFTPVESVEPEPDEEAVSEEFAEPGPQEEIAHSPVTPLFEPEPYLRMPRPAFGRKAGRFS